MIFVTSQHPEESASPAPTVKPARQRCGAETRKESRCVTHVGSTQNYTGWVQMNISLYHYSHLNNVRTADQ